MTVICETNGIAGCGKTTLIEAVGKYLVESGRQCAFCRVEDFNKKDSLKTVRFISKIANLVYVSLPSCCREFKILWKRIRASEQAGTIRTSKYGLLVQCLYICYLLRNYKTQKAEVLLTDEGIVQLLAAFIVCTGYSENIESFVNELLCRIPKGILMVEFQINIEVTKERLFFRGRKETEMDYFDAEQLEDFLNSYKTVLEQIRGFCSAQGFEVLRIDATCSVDHNKKVVSEKISKLMA